MSIVYVLGIYDLTITTLISLSGWADIWPNSDICPNYILLRATVRHLTEYLIPAVGQMSPFGDM